MDFSIEAEERLVVLKRMCKLSSAILITALATLVVGIMALTYSDGKFPFNAGGAIIAGIAALFLSCCPICMLVQAKQYQKTRKSSYNCCCMALFIWSFIAILGILFGLGTNGIGAIIDCNSCWLNKESQMALAIITVVLTSVLLVLIITLYIIFCCNCVVCDITEFPDYTSRAASVDPRSQTEIYRISRIDESPGFTLISTRVTDTNSARPERPPSYIEPTAPPVFTQFSSDAYFTTDNASRNFHNTSNCDFDNSSNSAYDENPTDFVYDSPPPSYNEVMENDPMETPL